jgi:hypothetical protein
LIFSAEIFQNRNWQKPNPTLLKSESCPELNSIN